jgi:hypothetical protein
LFVPASFAVKNVAKTPSAANGTPFAKPASTLFPEGEDHD